MVCLASLNSCAPESTPVRQQQPEVSTVGGSSLVMNGVPATIIGDINGDGVVNGADLGLLLSGWAQPGPTDLNNDGTTNGADLGLLLSHWS